MFFLYVQTNDILYILTSFHITWFESPRVKTLDSPLSIVQAAAIQFRL